MQTVPSVSPQDKSKALRGEIDQRVEALAKAVDEVRASETFRAYLDVQARFHRYSWHNCMLIYMQRPDASRVAGFESWKKLGRHVRKGERGIRIFAPCPWKRENPDTGDTEAGLWFKVVSVFDVAQTDGNDLPEVDVPVVSDDGAALLAKLVSVARARQIEVAFVQLSPGLFGVSKGGAVEVNDTHPTGQQAKTLAHELAHEALHKTQRGSFTREMAELEAESVAYVVCAHFGLDVEVRASRYIALWNGNGKALRESLDRIGKTARELIDEVENSAGTTDVAVKAVAA